MPRIHNGSASIVAVALACAAPLALLASVNSLVPARTGGFGEMTCHQCHSNNPLNDPAGRLTLAGVPASYTPGQRYLITVSVAHPQLVRAGFQLSTRFESGDNAGMFHPPDDRTEAVPDDAGRIIYMQHTPAGTEVPTPGTGQWTFEWTAPAGDLPIAFHLAANAANGDGLPRGDFIYTATAISVGGP
ncbi:MAG: hypothetical protein HYY76_03490 [Acidobacteria bacterium]|nr:hypothetical protein [Acidobacteriota bacterium]